MNFKKIEVFGFKSFADKLEIKFDDGITAIVGPNGCGKSNVADSIRWVLGEQSAKQLRGHSMQDVIFSGTEKRKSLSYCEVSLFFDNTSRIINLDFNEIVLSRKLYRSGESVYSINRTECRLKDIIELLRDSGMGREGYSIIGQGRVDEVLSAKPDDRRAIFEEAAGISKFKSRKVDAERKLGRTRENLIRINDILSELERQLEPLSRQAENARKYLDLKERQKFYDVNTYIHQYESITATKNEINDRLNGIMQEYELKNRSYEKAISDYTSALNENNSLDKTIEELREELLVLTVGMEKQAGEIKLLNEKLSYLREQNERLSKDVERNTAEYNEIVKETEDKSALLEEKSLLLKKHNKELNTVHNKYLEVIDKLTKGEGEAESTQEQVMEAMTRLTDIKSNMSRLLAERQSLLEREKELSKRITVINNKITDDEIKAILLSNEIDKSNKEKSKLTEKRDEFSTYYNEGQSKLFEHNKYLEDLNVKHNTAKARHKMLADMHNDSQGFSYAVRKLMKDVEINHYLDDKIEGVIAKLIKVPEKYEAAVETALGNSVQNIVTRTEEDAKYIIGYLKQNNYGRATFLPMSAIKPRTLEREYQSKLNRTGCFGVASDLITYDSKYDDIMRGLLGRTVITDNLDTAIKLARDCSYSFKIVTLDGDVVNPHGAISGGSRKSELANILSHERELEKTANDMEKFRKDLLHAESDKQHMSSAQEKLLEDIRSHSEKIHDVDIVIATNKEKHDKYVIGIEEQKREIFVLEQETLKVTGRINEIDNDIKSVDELETLINSKKETAASSMQKHHEESDVFKKERDTLHDEITVLKVKIAALESGIMSLDSELTRLKNASVDLLGAIEENNSQIDANNKTIEAAQAAFETVSTEKTPVDEGRITEIREKLANLDSYRQSLQSKMLEYDAEKNALMQIIQNLTDNQYKERSLLEKVDIDLEVMKEKIAEEYQLDYEGCLQYREEEYDVTKGQTESAKLRRQINALGYVNVNAIEDCKTIGERYSDMSTQRDDLLKAELDLNKIIDELTGEMATRFKVEFEKINNNFTKIFKELFGGGNASLILQDSDNLLEAGIDIVAEPPGKKLQTISLLSGGERALTAIAILFAILRLKPMPFCVLDEIEAALDDANADRFARYLHRFSKETQFIVITHRKPTMELADSLYGVTMEEKGVSKMVSVKLADAVKAAGID